jgi:Family of unknown function (DUF5372)
MNNECQSTVHNTPPENHTRTIVVTYPHHPLFEQQFEFVRLRRGKQPLVEIRLPTGNTARLPVDYTDYLSANSADSFTNNHVAEENLLDMDGLLKVVGLISAIKGRRRVRKGEVSPSSDRTSVA